MLSRRLKDQAIQNCNDPQDWPFPNVAAAAARLKPDLVIDVGDYLYRESPCPAGNSGCAGTPYGDNWPAWKADFFAPAAPLLAAAPWVFVRGNHEDCERTGRGYLRLLGPLAYAPTCVGHLAPYRVKLGDFELMVMDNADVALVAYSCDKNFGLYRERTGALFARARGQAAVVRSNILMLVRCAWSMPPDHGAAVVRTILESEALTADWRAELETMRLRLVGIRQALAAAYPPLGALAGHILPVVVDAASCVPAERRDRRDGIALDVGSVDDPAEYAPDPEDDDHHRAQAQAEPLAEQFDRLRELAAHRHTAFGRGRHDRGVSRFDVTGAGTSTFHHRVRKRFELKLARAGVADSGAVKIQSLEAG